MQCRSLDSDQLIEGTLVQPSILLAEHSLEMQEWLACVLTQAFADGLIFPCTSVRRSREILAVQPVDIAVVDLCLPDGCGIEIVQECVRRNPKARCVIATVYDNDDYLHSVLSAGALGYILKDQPETVLIQQFRLLAQGIPPLAPSIAQRLVRYFADQPTTPVSSADDAGIEDDLLELSEREKQVLRLIAKGMQISEVAQLLEITSNTVASHIKSIYRKRNVSCRAEAALEAKRLGLA